MSIAPISTALPRFISMATRLQFRWRVFNSLKFRSFIIWRWALVLGDHASRDIGIFLAYNLADQHEDGELLDVFISQFRAAFVRPTEPASPSSNRSRRRWCSTTRRWRRWRATWSSSCSERPTRRWRPRAPTR